MVRAKIENVLHSPFKGEAGQLDRLVATVLPQYDVKFVIVTVIANNVGFADIVQDCGLAYLGQLAGCRHEWWATVPQVLADNQALLAAALSEIRATLDAHGQTGTQIMLQSYASPIHEDLRSFGKIANGCPYYGADAQWAYRDAVPAFSRVMRSARRRRDEVPGPQHLVRRPRAVRPRCGGEQRVGARHLAD